MILLSKDMRLQFGVMYLLRKWKREKMNCLRMENTTDRPAQVYKKLVELSDSLVSGTISRTGIGKELHAMRSTQCCRSPLLLFLGMSVLICLNDCGGGGIAYAAGIASKCSACQQVMLNNRESTNRCCYKPLSFQSCISFI